MLCLTLRCDRYARLAAYKKESPKSVIRVFLLRLLSERHSEEPTAQRQIGALIGTIAPARIGAHLSKTNGPGLGRSFARRRRSFFRSSAD